MIDGREPSIYALGLCLACLNPVWMWGIAALGIFMAIYLGGSEAMN